MLYSCIPIWQQYRHRKVKAIVLRYDADGVCSLFCPDADSCYPFMEMSPMNNGLHAAPDRPAVLSPVDRMHDRITSTYFPSFPLTGADGPFFPPTADAFMQAAAAAMGRQVPGSEPRAPGSDALPGELACRSREASSPPGGDRVNRSGTDEDEDVMSALSCAESDGTASPGYSLPGTAELAGDMSPARRPSTDIEMIAS